MACTRLFRLATAAHLTWYLALVLICVAAAAAPTFSASSAFQQHKDRRVAQLRAALLDSALYNVETLSDPPLELGVHTACKKFGRGCPDAYIQFLEGLLNTLRAEATDGDCRNRTSGNAQGEEAKNLTRQAQAEASNDAMSHERSVFEAPQQYIWGVDDRITDGAVSLASLLPRDLRLPLQLSWPYEARKRLENLHHLLATREAEFHRDGVALTSLQRLYHVPPAERIHLVEDLDGVMAAWLHTACAIGSSSSSVPLPTGWTEQKWEDVYGLWCRHVEQCYQNRRNADLNAANMTTATPSSLLPLPRKAWRCIALHHVTLYLQLLVGADQLLTSACSWTFCVAVPSAFLTCILLWLCVGDAWTEAAEAFMVNSSVAAPNATDQDNGEVNGLGESSGTEPSTTQHECRPTSTATGSPSTPSARSPVRGTEAELPMSPVPSVAFTEGRHGTASAQCDAVPASEHCYCQLQRQRERQQQRRAALLRCRFAESVLHRSSTLFFLKLRLLLCLLVAGQLLWSLWCVLAASYNMTASAASLVQFFLPSWLLACLSAYLVVPLQVVVLGTALKGALSAHEELLSFQAKCAAEQRALLNAAGVLPSSG
ncbi:conserved hypothetical protein [Leishmania braziliensis MHOM/BR/75/M2904]|uniref:Uncharacterized protein n=2 Tax=Leishmania braziliensis TaxID=5660 RepID=A4HHD2_LEIBR|nr:conserved hypothetical protein [Leishmania braziliensis MHOM/BR/75/M2904]CAJ2476510.1 unnamed protein product [Leishmania braziliensis]CAM39984.1 conserved hypothetical protein [Leishmania braziliensis MHOM/BR/75/M2904]SYZ67648.1 hypothetical_protein [Leishmania braziliensis MHOM/BR/75/M2904]